MSSNRDTLAALVAAAKRKDHEAFRALWVDDDLAYHWSMHARPVTTKEKLRNYSGRIDPPEWTITHCVGQDDLVAQPNPTGGSFAAWPSRMRKVLR